MSLMSFDQDPNEQANISGADLAMMVDEMAKQRALIRQLGFALIEAWPMVHQPLTSDTRRREVERAMFAFRDWCGPADQPGMLPTLSVGSFNPWKDEIVIEGLRFQGAAFRDLALILPVGSVIYNI